MICPLNWGLGHATRCIPLARAFLSAGCEVVVAAEEPPLSIFRDTFGNQLSYHLLPGKTITYPTGRGMAWHLLRQMPGYAWALWREYKTAKKLVQKVGADILVSDNRYGLFVPGVKRVFITHQLFIRMPARLKPLEPFLLQLNKLLIRPYHHCWVPDLPGTQNLSGDLSHKKGWKNRSFIGPLSRFPIKKGHKPSRVLPAGFPAVFDLLIVSGPEPQRSLLESKLLGHYKKHSHAAVMVRGLPGKEGDEAMPLPDDLPAHILAFNHLGQEEMQELITSSRLVVSRPGYSTIMDLAMFGKRALFIPTPGQTEQEYLGKLLADRGWAVSTDQECETLHQATREALGCKGIPSLVSESSTHELHVRELLSPTG